MYSYSFSQGITEASLRNEERDSQSEESAALTAARALLDSEEEMQAVHSTKSVAALLKSAKDKIAQVKASVHPSVAAEPKILNEVTFEALCKCYCKRFNPFLFLM